MVLLLQALQVSLCHPVKINFHLHYKYSSPFLQYRNSMKLVGIEPFPSDLTTSLMGCTKREEWIGGTVATRYILEYSL